jgi:hypothetical protein
VRPFLGGSGVSRRAIFWTIVALTGALVLAVVGVIVFSFANAEELLEDAGSELAARIGPGDNAGDNTSLDEALPLVPLYAACEPEKASGLPCGLGSALDVVLVPWRALVIRG